MSESASVSDQKAKGLVENSLDQTKNVYIWDMDETLILLKSLLNGTYAEAFNGSKNVKEGLEIGKMWEKHILDLCDNHFFYEEVIFDNESYAYTFLDEERKILWYSMIKCLIGVRREEF